MAYEKTIWENGKLLINAERLNKMEEGIANASVNVPGSYVVRLPADTPVQVSQTSYGMHLNYVAAESYDNFADILFNGGNVVIDTSAVDLSSYGLPRMTYSVVSPMMWNILGGVMNASGTTVFTTVSNPILLTAVCNFPNGTWTPPTA